MFPVPTYTYLMTQSAVPFPFVIRNTCQSAWSLQSGAVRQAWRWGGLVLEGTGAAERHSGTFHQLPRSSDTLGSLPCQLWLFHLQMETFDLWDPLTGPDAL